ncbi:MAG: GntR family transcriptional regulator [Acidibacillus sp.]|uniref:Fatty acid metabolism regulator protein n=1 Tax=Sulfoacidibacillus ferrooxidans TaxID=2005001 RepID=A0A9X1V6Q7_9BACL|nr:GntR family transcriptional regulator [Sulfoacidibacillus ferrooxidans]MCI0182541.1 Fatty acid metabolism regulator protein [Sulfoacidibacillus ferrooxidans]MCY0894187.1 GntR family transcriptional regulator [Acidibacillus sp.]
MFIRQIADGELEVGTVLPPERELALLLGVSRSTVRETLQRMACDGFVQTRKGQPALVLDYRKTGNLATLVQLVQLGEQLSSSFIEYFLEIRSQLAPLWISNLMRRNTDELEDFLRSSSLLHDDAGTYALYDFQLQKVLAEGSGNPIYLFLVNSLAAVYQAHGNYYFSLRDQRQYSSQFYRQLLQTVSEGRANDAEQLVRVVMEESALRFLRLMK